MIDGLRGAQAWRLWLRSWLFYWRAVYRMRTKKHGAGAQPWPLCFAMGRAYRYVVFGQHRRRA